MSVVRKSSFVARIDGICPSGGRGTLEVVPGSNRVKVSIYDHRSDTSGAIEVDTADLVKVMSVLK